MTARGFAMMALAVALTGCPPPAGGDDDDDGGGGDFHTVTLPETDGVDRARDTVTGVRCESATSCAITTRNRDEGGALFVTGDGTTLEPVLTGAEIEADVPGLGAEVGFLGVDDTGAGWVARIDVASRLVLATGDPITAASWALVEPGTNDADSDFRDLSNQELVRAGTDGSWLYVTSGIIWAADAAPSATTAWAGVWSPNRIPPFPRNYDELKADDPTLCDSDPTIAVAPDMGRFGYASPDLGFVIYPAGGPNQARTDVPGVCVSHDRARTFHQVPFAGLDPAQVGPLAVQCLDADRCWAIGGVDFDSAPAYVYYSTDASAAAPTWLAATVPTQADRDSPRALAMAPDGEHGWLVGNRGLAWRTSDGGATWTDESVAVAAVAGDDVTFHAVEVLDGGSVWIGGEDGVLLAGD
jgi:hypothetical protein